MFTIEHLPSGNQSLRLVGPGLTEATAMVRVRGTSTVNLKSTLQRVQPYHIRIVDDDGKPIPFRAVRTYATHNAMVQVRSQLRTMKAPPSRRPVASIS